MLAPDLLQANVDDVVLKTSLAVKHTFQAASEETSIGGHAFFYLYFLSIKGDPKRVGTAQLVERPTEKPGTKLTRVRVPGAARDCSPRVSFQCRLSYGVCTAPRSVQTLKNSDTGSHSIVCTHESTARTDGNG